MKPRFIGALWKDKEADAAFAKLDAQIDMAGNGMREHFNRGRQQGWDAGLAVRDMDVALLARRIQQLEDALWAVEPIVEHHARNPLALQAQAALRRLKEVLP